MNKQAEKSFRESRFEIDCLPGVRFVGYTDGSDWNGFACPYFDLTQP